MSYNPCRASSPTPCHEQATMSLTALGQIIPMCARHAKQVKKQLESRGQSVSVEEIAEEPVDKVQQWRK